MRTGTLTLILTSVTLSALAQASFKFGMSASTSRLSQAGMSPVFRMVMTLTTPGVLGGLVLYGIGTLLWLQVLSRIDLSQAYPFVGIGFIITALIGVFGFGETMTAMRAVGISLVIIGIYVVARS